jgi:Methylamine utilisation protein MauE
MRDEEERMNAGRGTMDERQPSSVPRSSSRVRRFPFIPHPSSLILFLCRFGLAAMFLFAVGAKLWTMREFAGNVANLVPDGWAWPAAWAVVSAELVAAALLLWPRTVRLGALASAALLVGFAAYALYYVYALRGEPLECGCFGGIIASQLGVSTALRNLALLVPAAAVFFLGRGRRGASARPEFR